MAREQETTSSSQQQQEHQRWGPLEELLLACAVNRHGTKSWDSIAMEVANRTSSLASLTPESCKDKFRDLKRRFMASNDAESTSLVPLVDQLRQIRVQELRDEVQRRDVSIVSLELKVKRLEEEREKSMKAEEADLERERKASPDIIAGKFSSADGDESDERENRSFNESNSTTQKAEETRSRKRLKNDVAEGEKQKEPKVKHEPDGETDPDPVRTGSGPDRDRDWSSNGKLNGNVKEDDEEDDDVDNDKTVSEEKMETINKNNKTSGLSESNELWDDSKREGKEVGVASKQSSDVQSSASLSNNKKRRRSSSGEEPDVEEVSPATKKVLAVKSEPLVRFLEIIRSHRLGSHFERRLRSQESERYKKLIRQHIDLQTIQSRLDRGLYSDCIQRFFRDLLILFNNFIIFFRKSSQEYAAALELRALVAKEMTAKLRKPQTPAVKPEPERQQQQQKPQKELLVSLSKPSRASTMVMCGKRNSAKGALENAAGRKGEKKEREIEEKPKVNEKKINGSFVDIEEKGGTKKKRSSERSVSGRRNLRNSNKGGEVKHQYGGNELSSHDALEVKMDKKEIAVRKKQGAASFLKRMKQNSPSEVTENDNDDDDDDKEEDDSENESKDSRIEEDANKRKGKKRDAGKERVTRSSRGRGVREESRRMKRGVGRPPKRSAASPPKKSVTVSPPERTGKRGRDNGESEVGVGGGSSRSRKRRRR
ncbi:hypothetical protein Pint_31273 [Pistacia integerrima]|uniref:Uncharacterized protein n=1 Tax=Pistacia integerrima TaxID=434235 RepID=A0ACC0XRK5_9ROSI|nr:hypothetical protein Pint_31273 [Pistacia integerrima]